ncbi:hypothetical protein FQR65_LT00876 [Abscondita terminalis]|nr:hypothetical protein FQR65_LT00876 [Abscondita terminalis]
MRVLVIEDDTTLGHGAPGIPGRPGVCGRLADRRRPRARRVGGPALRPAAARPQPAWHERPGRSAPAAPGRQSGSGTDPDRPRWHRRSRGRPGCRRDDYVTKAFELPELAARVRAFGRRRAGQAQPLIEVGPAELRHRGPRSPGQWPTPGLVGARTFRPGDADARVGRVVTKRQIVNSLSAWDADFSENAGRSLRVPAAQAPGRHGRQHPDGAWFRLHAGCRSALTGPGGRFAPAAPPTAYLRAPGHDAGTHPSRRRPGLAPAAPLPFPGQAPGHPADAAHLLLVLLDLVATWVITHKIEMSLWMLEDFFWLMVAGQVALIALFTWVVVQGVRSGLRSVNHLSEEIRQRSIDDMQPLEVAGVPVEIEPLVTHTNDLLLRLDASLAAQRRFIGHAAHQLRTPLSGGQRPHDPPGQQLLVLARADPNARPQDSFVRIDLCEWVRAHGAEWFPRAREARHELDLVAPETPIWIDADPLLLAELLGNLIDNALRYGNDTGRIVLIVGANPPSLTVEDDGPGIPFEERDRVFEAFYRSPTAIAGGSGLGLAIVREIAHAHGAWWKLTSRPDFPGTRLSVVFPGPRKGAQLTRQDPTS